MHFAYRRAARVIAHNQPMREMIVDKCGIPSERIDVVPLIERGDPESQAGVTEETGTVLCFGRIWPYKGLEYLIKAEPLITAAFPHARIVIAGRGEDFTRYRRMMIHTENFVVNNEFVSVEKRATLFRSASVVVLPYVEATQSGVIPIAYTYGKPVVATAVGGLVEQVEEGVTGFLVPPRDPRLLAERIVQLLGNEPLRRYLGRNGRRKLMTEWSAAVITQQTLEVYRRAIGDHRSRSLQRPRRSSVATMLRDRHSKP